MIPKVYWARDNEKPKVLSPSTMAEYYALLKIGWRKVEDAS